MKSQDAHDRDVLLAWHVGLFSRLKTLGDPSKWFSRAGADGQEQQSPKQQVMVVKILAEMGGTFTTRAQREAAKAARPRGKGQRKH